MIGISLIRVILFNLSEVKYYQEEIVRLIQPQSIPELHALALDHVFQQPNTKKKVREKLFNVYSKGKKEEKSHVIEKVPKVEHVIIF